MNQIELQKINESLYPEAQIYWEYNKGYSSDLLKRLLKSGYSLKSRSSVKFVSDTDGNKIASGIGAISLLMELAKAMR